MSSVNKCEYYKVENGKRKKCRNNALTDQRLCKIHGKTGGDVSVPEDNIIVSRSFGANMYREGLKDKEEEKHTAPPVPVKVCYL